MITRVNNAMQYENNYMLWSKLMISASCMQSRQQTINLMRIPTVSVKKFIDGF